MAARSIANGYAIRNDGQGWVYDGGPMDGQPVPSDMEANVLPICNTCGKPQHIIYVEHLPQKDKLGRENGRERWGGIPVDACIGKEVELLLNAGIVTVACCCGHKTHPPKCLILEESVELAKEYGYKPIHFEGDRWEIRLK